MKEYSKEAPSLEGSTRPGREVHILLCESGYRWIIDVSYDVSFHRCTYECHLFSQYDSGLKNSLTFNESIVDKLANKI